MTSLSYLLPHGYYFPTVLSPFLTLLPLGFDYMQMRLRWGNSQTVAPATLSALLLSFPLYPK